MATLRDVAKLSGVSVATVSNVLNARSDRVSPETRERVLAAVRQLRYRPTALEKNQKAIVAQNLGVMVTDLTKNPILLHGYFRNTLDGIMEAAMFRGWSVTIFAEKMWDDLGLAIRRSYDGRCDGLIVIAPIQDSETVRTLQERGVPLVLVGATAPLPGVSSVDIDNEAAGAMAATHLLELGHKRFAFIAVSSIVTASNERERAFRARLASAGFDGDAVQTFRLREIQSIEALADILAQESPRRTGVFCWHDAMAVDLIPLLQRRGVSVPRDMSFVGVDDDPKGQTMSPPLTTFHQPLHAIGKRAANLLIDRLGEDRLPDEVVRFGVELLPRGSSGPAPTP
ncbi:LacI family DNA-binding transcriptional regulator [Fimbriimonas ginsengisoli]|uniref:ChaR3 protein n=1 Tax=Fimbriimonas ginsengisoli Gsoil 348 TaxID=661478 RepID=A0A068NUL7_FIMGI|nr:LacI family DNA-binding transcriptional regulator [Fimbriimonas ginsengisoli]AIE87121.1 ChaR3 protein [Fimbriimonas ginsengisoli Gsoil 348]